MEDVLIDTEMQITSKPPNFARLAFWVSILTTVLCINLLAFYFRNEDNVWGISIVACARITLVSVFIGAVLSLTSILKKEKLKYLKSIGTILNFLFFTFFLIVILLFLIYPK